MGTEIERKFLLASEAWRSQAGQGSLYRQGYLAAGCGTTVRVRIAGDEARLTVKGPSDGVSRAEYEYPLPIDDAVEMLGKLCTGGIIEKRRYRIELGDHVWEIDEFLGANAGLVVAEIELTSPRECFSRPPWLGEEVSGDPRYFNASLCQTPYCLWRS